METDMVRLSATMGENTTYIAICINVPNEKDIPQTVQALVERLPFSWKMPCGNTYSLDIINDLPKNDLSCPCGNPHHWFVKYYIKPELDKREQ